MSHSSDPDSPTGPSRRGWLGATAGAAAAALASPAFSQPQEHRDGHAVAAPFHLRYAPHFGMFRHLAGDDLVAQLEFAAGQGFRAWEDNSMAGRPVEEQARLATVMQRLGISMGVFVANFGTAFGKKSFASGSPDMLESFLADMRKAVEVAKRVDAKWCTIVLGDMDPGLAPEFQAANAIEMLKRGAEVCEPHGLVMVMEPLNPWHDHPGMFLQRIPQAFMLCKAVASPSCKILFDIYHQQITEGNLIPNIDRAWDEIGYFQIGDNPGRNEPGTGEIAYGNVFRYLHRKGWRGLLGMEHGNSLPGKEGEEAVLAAYRQADDFAP
ncbi:MAG TPA: TIM barrel protein [Planctomycetota bacterium]